MEIILFHRIYWIFYCISGCGHAFEILPCGYIPDLVYRGGTLHRPHLEFPLLASRRFGSEGRRMRLFNLDQVSRRIRNGNPVLWRRTALLFPLGLDPSENWSHQCDESGSCWVRPTFLLVLGTDESVVRAPHRIAEWSHFRSILLHNGVVRKHCSTSGNRGHHPGMNCMAT